MPDLTVYCYCYDHIAPTGGQKDTYKHVDALNKLGIRAFIVHQEPGFRLAWFPNDTPVIDNATFRRNHRPSRDVVVLPEDLGEKMNLYSGYRVIHDKNIYYGFRSWGLTEAMPYPTLDRDVIGMLAVSNHNLEHLRFSYPSIPVYRIWPEIDRNIFRPMPLASKRLRFVYPRKVRNQIATLVNMLRVRGAVHLNKMHASEWIMAESLTQNEMASLLKETICVIFLSTEEGLGLLPLEAIASGCLVASYGTGPLRETMPLWYQFEYGNLVAIASFIESVMAHYPDRIEYLQEYADRSLHTLDNFTPERHLKSVRDAWDGILDNQHQQQLHLGSRSLNLP